jgi:hypothetical protein
MYASKRRTIPINVSIWMEQGVTVRKETASSGLLPNNTRSNVFLSRKFYSDMLNLSSERHRKLARCDYNKKMFLKNQRHKAEIGMPGLLPYVFTRDYFFIVYCILFRYIKQHQEEENENDQDSRILPTVQSVAIQSMMMKSIPKKQNKSSNRQQISLERINRLSQPKGRRFDPSSKDHIRSNMMKNVNAHDLFENIDKTSHRNFSKSKESEMSINDRRFQKLIYLFSEMHEREPTSIQSVKSVIQSNTSLQSDTPKNVSAIEYENQSDLFNHSSYNETDSYLIEACV